MELISVSSRGQVVIPEKTRKKYGIKQGTKLVLIEKENTLLLKKEEEVAKHFDDLDRKEEYGWIILGEASLKEVWKNKKDEKTWSKYIE